MTLKQFAACFNLSHALTIKTNQRAAYAYLSRVARDIRTKRPHEAHAFICAWPAMQAYIKGIPWKGRLIP
jgi:hypothetical protein